MHPQIAKTLADQRREELMHAADHHSQELTAAVAKPGWLNRHLPRWHVSWSRTVLSPAGVPQTTGSRQTRRDKRGSSLVIIISAYRSA